MVKRKVKSIAKAKNDVVGSSFKKAGSALQHPYGKGKKNPMKVKPIGSYKVPQITKMMGKKR